MSEIQYNLQFEKLCDTLQIGKIIGVPRAISGGLLHRMYAVETSHGKYAIKLLNPQIMLRPAAMQNMIDSERVANIAASKVIRQADSNHMNHIPALPAKIINGSVLHKIDNQYYLVFDWVEGRSLKRNEIKIIHCEKIGAILADIHRMDFSEAGKVNKGSDKINFIEWNIYLQKGKEDNSDWLKLFEEIIDKLYDWYSDANKATINLASEIVISHRDLDPKNVLWCEDNPIIIDWESAGFVNPMRELVETAIYWSENEIGVIDQERFCSFINGYKKRYGKLHANWKEVLVSGFSGKLEWLEYNLNRSLCIECNDKEEQQLGKEQVIGTINDIKRYANMIGDVETWL